MTSVRIIFLGEGFQGYRPKPDRPYEAMTLFSVRLDGTGLSVMKKEVVQPSQSVAFDLFADGYSAPWPRKDHWAVCRALPRKVMIVDSMGQVEAESDAMGVLPAWPERVAEERLPQVQARWSTPHVVGLVPAGPRLGVVWQQPPSSGSQFRVEWMDENLKVAGESAFNLPRQLDPMSFVRKVSVGPDGRIYILVVKRELASPGISTLYASTLIAP